ncbi:MAG: hypothetical protein OXS47_13695 [Chloroflexota bacterium]|nr:hypothetical protein [Chloroflexota bacterium]
MRTLELREYEPCEAPLSVEDRDTLRAAIPSLTVEPVIGQEAIYRLTPGSTVGALELGDLAMSIRPKLEVSRVLFLASYAMGAFRLQDEPYAFEDKETLVEALAPAFAAAARRAFGRGLLYGYRTEEEALHTVRGRIMVAEQVRRRFDIPLPVEVRYDDFTDDILPNRLVKAAASVLGAMHIEAADAREGLRWMDATLGNVSLMRFSPLGVPAVAFNRLNEHYREVVELSRLILRYRAIEMDRGGVRANGFLMDMTEVFQGFVTRALRESLGVSDRTLRSDKDLPGTLWLDKGRRVRLRPDLSWWDGATCTFVGDAKYKRVQDERVPNADLYQMLAYATALDLPGGLLAYAEGEEQPVVHEVRNAGKRVEVAAVNLSGSIADIRASIDELAQSVRALRDEARHLRRAA